MTENITLGAFVKAHGIKMSAEYADTNPNMPAGDETERRWNDSASHFRVTFRAGRRRMTTYYSMGSALRGEPTTEDVLDCLASDASGIENARSFEEWASEYGYDTDSRKAERTFKACERAARKLRAFLGDETYEQLLWHTERL